MNTGSNNSKNIRNTVFAEDKQADNCEYKIYDKIDGISSSPCVEITNCGDEDIVDIPAQIKGYPVVSIAEKTFSGNAQQQSCLEHSKTWQSIFSC